MAVDPTTFDGDVSQATATLFKAYEQYRREVGQGVIGKTAQFWVSYLDLMRIQHQIHTSVQTNDFDMRLDSWEKILPMYFAFNKTNYARYGTWYVQTLKEIDDRYPGLKPLLQSFCLSAQAQTSYPIRTSIDQRGEQSINRDAKTPGIYVFRCYYESVSLTKMGAVCHKCKINIIIFFYFKYFSF